VNVEPPDLQEFSRDVFDVAGEPLARLFFSVDVEASARKRSHLVSGYCDQVLVVLGNDKVLTFEQRQILFSNENGATEVFFNYGLECTVEEWTQPYYSDDYVSLEEMTNIVPWGRTQGQKVKGGEFCVTSTTLCFERDLFIRKRILWSPPFDLAIPAGDSVSVYYPREVTLFLSSGLKLVIEGLVSTDGTDFLARGGVKVTLLEQE
jgi:hypothetical protein